MNEYGDLTKEQTRGSIPLRGYYHHGLPNQVSRRLLMLIPGLEEPVTLGIWQMRVSHGLAETWFSITPLGVMGS